MRIYNKFIVKLATEQNPCISWLTLLVACIKKLGYKLTIEHQGVYNEVILHWWTV